MREHRGPDDSGSLVDVDDIRSTPPTIYLLRTRKRRFMSQEGNKRLEPLWQMPAIEESISSISQPRLAEKGISAPRVRGFGESRYMRGWGDGGEVQKTYGRYFAAKKLELFEGV